jgi:predicted N-acyltransferase
VTADGSRAAAGPGVARARFLGSIADIDAASWNALAGTAQPFLRHEFLLALEQSGCAVPRTGWSARHLVLEDAHGRAIGALPLYLKSHSRGEFVFDFSWANAYAEHGLAYYPKLVSAVPFTPVRGARFLVAGSPYAPQTMRALVKAASALVRTERLSSWHVLFPSEQDLPALREGGLIERRDCQFHWFNQNYASFDAFLATFTAEKRKKAKRERRRVAEAGIVFDTRFGGEIDAALWRTLYEFYADTFYRHGHEPYLNLDFFKRIAARLPDKLVLKIARIGAEPIAVAIFFVGSDALFGRYWGAGGNYHSLHFETCYYQGIEYCIEHGLKRFEPGTQGEHKVPRGFVPTLMGSAHDIVDRRFAAAIRDFAQREARSVDHYAAAVNEHVPYHRAPDEELAL